MLKPLVNLNFIEPNQILVDDESRYFIIENLSRYKQEQVVKLVMIEINEYFTIWSVTLPIACDKDMIFTSVNDKDFKFKFFETPVTKQGLAKSILNKIEESIKEAEPSILDNFRETINK